MSFNKYTNKLLAIAIVLLSLNIVLMLALVAPKTAQKAFAADECKVFLETGYKVCGLFLSYWENNGGLAQYGFPISPEFLEKNADPPAGDGKVHKVQYFERTRFEDHPENGLSTQVLLGLLGSEQYQAKYAPIVPTPTPLPTVQPLVIKNKRDVEKIGTFTPKIGYKFVIIDASLTNNTKSTISSNAFFFSLRTNTNTDYNISNATFALPTNLNLKQLATGETVSGELVFETPTTETTQSITFADGNNNFRTNV